MEDELLNVKEESRSFPSSSASTRRKNSIASRRRTNPQGFHPPYQLILLIHVDKEDGKLLRIINEGELLSVNEYVVILVDVEELLRRNRGDCPYPPQHQ